MWQVMSRYYKVTNPGTCPHIHTHIHTHLQRPIKCLIWPIQMDHIATHYTTTKTGMISHITTCVVAYGKGTYLAVFSANMLHRRKKLYACV